MTVSLCELALPEQFSTWASCIHSCLPRARMGLLKLWVSNESLGLLINAGSNLAGLKLYISKKPSRTILGIVKAQMTIQMS